MAILIPLSRPASNKVSDVNTRLTILTGTTRGLGAAMAAQLASQGGHLVTVARSASAPLAQLAQDSGTALTHVFIDLLDAGAVERAAIELAALTRAHLAAGHTRVRVIHNAGVVGPIAMAHQLTDLHAINQAFQVNIAAPIFLTAHLLTAASLAADLRIMLISSGAGRSPTAGWGVYCATKAALDRYAQVIALEQGASSDTRVRVASIAPGVVDTDMQATIRGSDPDNFPARDRFMDMHTLHQLISPELTAQRLLQVLDSDQFGAQIIDDIRQHTF